MNDRAFSIGDRVRIVRPNILWAGETGSVKHIVRNSNKVIHYIVRAERNFDMQARPDELELISPAVDTRKSG
jgi:hypothetical protein